MVSFGWAQDVAASVVDDLVPSCYIFGEPVSVIIEHARIRMLLEIVKIVVDLLLT